MSAQALEFAAGYVRDHLHGGSLQVTSFRRGNQSSDPVTGYAQENIELGRAPGRDRVNVASDDFEAAAILNNAEENLGDLAIDLLGYGQDGGREVGPELLDAGPSVGPE